MISFNSHKKSKVFTLVLLLSLVMLSSLLGRRKKPEPSPSLVRDQDIKIWDESSLRGYNGKAAKKGSNFKSKSTWTLTTDFWSQRSSIEKDIFNGKYGRVSGKNVYTTYRPLVQLSNEEYTEGKKTILDNQVSNLVTPLFEVKLDYITFLISGGYAPGKACINLLIDGKVVRTATGRNSDYLEWAAFDVREFKGKEVRIQVLDKTVSSFGYIIVDCICQSPDKKGALEVISKAPKAEEPSLITIETVDAKLNGAVSAKGSSLSVNGKNISLENVLQFRRKGNVGDSQARRIELVNGDKIICTASSFEKDNLKFKHSLLGEKTLSPENIAQIKFSNGPSVDLKPGTLLHENGNKIPGELTWIRENNVSLKCALGQLPLPVARVSAFVFNKKHESKNQDVITLNDGTSLSGKLTIANGAFSLQHAFLGTLSLDITAISQIVLHKENLTGLKDIKFEVKEKSGPLTPPEPQFISDSSQNLLRIHSSTTLHFSLSQQSGGRLKSVLKPVANCSTEMTVVLKSGNNQKKYTLEPKSKGLAVDFALAAGQGLEMQVNSKEKVSYPSGVEWHGAIIIEDKK